MAFTSSSRAARYGLNWKRRLPPARERLAQHSGGGSREIVGTPHPSGDNWERDFFKARSIRYRSTSLSSVIPALSRVSSSHASAWRETVPTLSPSPSSPPPLGE